MCMCNEGVFRMCEGDFKTLDLVRAIPGILNVIVDPIRVTPDTLNVPS